MNVDGNYELRLNYVHCTGMTVLRLLSPCLRTWSQLEQKRCSWRHQVSNLSLVTMVVSSHLSLVMPACFKSKTTLNLPFYFWETKAYKNIP